MRSLLGILLILGIQIQTASTELTFCSPENAGSLYLRKTDSFMSNGLCSTECNGYSYGIVLMTKCWCTNSGPSVAVSDSECDSPCPGYPSEQCGNESKNYYGYIYLGNGSPPTTPTTDGSSKETGSVSASDNEATATSQKTSTQTSAEPTSTNENQTGDSSHITSVIYSVMTITGGASTQVTTTEILSTVISLPTQTGAASSTNSNGNASSSSASSGTGNGKNSDNEEGFFDDRGKVAGVFTAIGAVILGLLGGLLFFILKKRKENYGDSDHESIVSYPADEKYLVSAQNTTLQRPIGPVIGVGDEVVQIDQRLDPNQMFVKWENGSRHSLADEMDYSRRVLRVTNADQQD